MQAWLAAGQGAAPCTIAGFDESTFYSDSINDLALLEAVTRPVAVRSDERLRARAMAAGSGVIDAL